MGMLELSKLSLGPLTLWLLYLKSLLLPFKKVQCNNALIFSASLELLFGEISNQGLSEHTSTK